MIGPFPLYIGGGGAGKKVWLNPANVVAVEEGMPDCTVLLVSGKFLCLDTEAEKVVRACRVKLEGRP